MIEYVFGEEREDMSGQRVVKETARKCLVRFRNGRGEERHEGCGGMWLAGCALVTVEGDGHGMGWHSSSGPL